jgi:hypothetical protein
MQGHQIVILRSHSNASITAKNFTFFWAASTFHPATLVYFATHAWIVRRLIPFDVGHRKWPRASRIMDRISHVEGTE